MVSPRPIRNSQFSCTDRAICTICHLIHGNHKRLYKVVVEKVVITACRGCSKVTKIIVTLRFYHNLLLVFLLFILLLKQKNLITLITLINTSTVSINNILCASVSIPFFMRQYFAFNIKMFQTNITGIQHRIVPCHCSSLQVSTW